MNLFYKVIPTVFLLSLPSLSIANTNEGLHVTGKALIEKAPDRFLVRMSVKDRGRLASKSKMKVDQITQSALNIIKSLGIQDANIKSSHIQITPIYHQNKFNPNKAYVAHNNLKQSAIVETELTNNDDKLRVEFDVTRQIEVQLDDFSQYEKLLDRVTKVGVNSISPVRSSISNAEQLYQQVLEKAVTNAKQKASKLAQQLGVVIKGVSSVEELSYRAPGDLMMAESSVMSRGKYQSYAGKSAVSAEVRVSFIISND